MLQSWLTLFFEQLHNLGIGSGGVSYSLNDTLCAVLVKLDEDQPTSFKCFKILL